MNVDIFWGIIGLYNSKTIIFQIALMILTIVSFILSFEFKKYWTLKLIMGINNLFIGIVFFGIYGTEYIQKYFSLPLFIVCGLLFIYESIKNKNDGINKLNYFQYFL